MANSLYGSISINYLISSLLGVKQKPKQQNNKITHTILNNKEIEYIQNFKY